MSNQSNLRAFEPGANALPVLVWGSSGHALVVADILRLEKQIEIVGYIDDRPKAIGNVINGVPVIGNREELERRYDAGIKHVIMGVGDCAARLDLALIARKKGFRFLTAIHPQAVIATGVTIVDGSVIVAGAVINPGVKIGEHAVINTSASVDHECVIDDGAHIGPGAHLGGCVSVGRATWVGIGAVVKDHVKIGAGAIIGAGAVVLNDIPDGVVAYGVPARVRRQINANE